MTAELQPLHLLFTEKNEKILPFCLIIIEMNTMPPENNLFIGANSW